MPKLANLKNKNWQQKRRTGQKKQSTLRSHREVQTDSQNHISNRKKCFTSTAQVELSLLSKDNKRTLFSIILSLNHDTGLLRFDFCLWLRPFLWILITDVATVKDYPHSNTVDQYQVKLGANSFSLIDRYCWELSMWLRITNIHCVGCFRNSSDFLQCLEFYQQHNCKEILYTKSHVWSAQFSCAWGRGWAVQWLPNLLLVISACSKDKRTTSCWRKCLI